MDPPNQGDLPRYPGKAPMASFSETGVIEKVEGMRAVMLWIVCLVTVSSLASCHSLYRKNNLRLRVPLPSIHELIRIESYSFNLDLAPLELPEDHQDSPSTTPIVRPILPNSLNNQNLKKNHGNRNSSRAQHPMGLDNNHIAIQNLTFPFTLAPWWFGIRRFGNRSCTQVFQPTALVEYYISEATLAGSGSIKQHYIYSKRAMYGIHISQRKIFITDELGNNNRSSILASISMNSDDISSLSRLKSWYWDCIKETGVVAFIKDNRLHYNSFGLGSFLILRLRSLQVEVLLDIPADERQSAELQDGDILALLPAFVSSSAKEILIVAAGEWSRSPSSTTLGLSKVLKGLVKDRFLLKNFEVPVVKISRIVTLHIQQP